jgi:hypothetical protein
LSFIVTGLSNDGPGASSAFAVLHEALNAARLEMMRGAISVTIRDSDKGVSTIKGAR